VAEKKWVRSLRASLWVGVALAVLYTGLHYFLRWTRPSLKREAPAPIQRVDDFYVHPPKSYVTDLASAQKLVGKPLWVIEGYRWKTQPNGRFLEPIEKIVPTAIASQGGAAVIRFERDGRTESVESGTPSRLYIDEMFFVKDPKEIYSHWTPETWEKIENHKIEPGMSEFQVAFALGAGNPLRSSQRGGTRIVEYTLCEAAGIEPVRITFEGGKATVIEPVKR
jgi:hypothetical protein